MERGALTGAPSKHPADIAGMFDAIAGRYDLLNRLLSAGCDRRWRARAVASLGLTGRETLADVCTGTADLAIGARRSPRGAARAIGIDFAPAMLAVGLSKVRQAGLTGSIILTRGDACRLPMRADTVDGATIAFGIRNVEDPAAACRELFRVLRPGGRIAILEFGVPTGQLFRGIYLWYFQVVLPRLGRWISRHGTAYSYLPASVGAFPPPTVFVRTLADAGFRDVSAAPLTGGIVYLYGARKPS